MDTATVMSNLLKGQNILTLLRFLNLIGFMWPQPAMVKNNTSYDMVVIGGGTAGCAIASELVKLNISVLLVEAGGPPPFESQFSGLFPFLKQSKVDWNFTSTNDNNRYRYHKGGVLDMQQGKVLGGTGQVNYLIYGKGIPADYDKWAEITNNTSWQFKQLCDIFKRIENVIDKKVLNSPDLKYHGTEGKIKLHKVHSSLNTDYFRSYEELGQKYLLDINPMNPVGHTNAYTNNGCGMRQSTAHSYLRLVKSNPHLSVLYNSLATEIIFDENKVATGVKILTENNTVITVNVNMEVIVSAGVIKSPQLLMLSGIGPKSHLEEQEIEVISDLPVGQNFIDNPTSILMYKMGPSDPFIAANPEKFPVSVMDGYVSVEQCQNKSDYEILSGVIVDPVFLIEACSHVFTFNNELCDFVAKSAVDRQVLFVTHSLLYPDSRGYIQLKDKNPETNPIIVTGHYLNDTDRIRHAKLVKHYHRVVETKYFKSVDAELIYPELETCKDLEKGTLEYFKCYVNEMVSSLHMYYGTCPMGSVVDAELKVKGVEKVRVADASVIPTGIGSTTFATTVMIAERLVDILKKEYNL
ncbi:ecdysone oxidase-like [Anticarsia gemmatalis]|uniref:ecdysone oxidase-like n=1 Tax=Anticarsia gemmatalis TaxID=129554 RepID=UPI003F76E2FF